MTIDIKANRRMRKWSKREKLGRLLWGLAHPLFAGSPRLAWGWRRALLRAFGAEVAPEAQIHPSVRIALPWNLEIGAFSAVCDRSILYSLGRITIGARTTISQGAHLCAGTH